MALFAFFLFLGGALGTAAFGPLVDAGWHRLFLLICGLGLLLLGGPGGASARGVPPGRLISGRQAGAKPVGERPCLRGEAGLVVSGHEVDPVAPPEMTGAGRRRRREGESHFGEVRPVPVACGEIAAAHRDLPDLARGDRSALRIEQEHFHVLHRVALAPRRGRSRTTRACPDQEVEVTALRCLEDALAEEPPIAPLG